MRRGLHEIIKHVNRKEWWHVPPADPDAYRKRGKFLASSYREACFWGRPLNEPQRATIAAPLVGDEMTIERRLFRKRISAPAPTLGERVQLDGKMKRAALAQGYDSIVLMSKESFARFKSEGKIPRSLELNELRAFRPHTLG